MPMTDLEMAELCEEQARKALASMFDWLQCDKKVITQQHCDNIWRNIRTLINYHLEKQKEELLWSRKIKAKLRRLIN
jgi:hypothetical protein